MKVKCPHCGGSIDVCIASGEIRRITHAAASTASLGVAENCARKAAKLTTDPEALRLILDSVESLKRANAALSESLDREEVKG